MAFPDQGEAFSIFYDYDGVPLDIVRGFRYTVFAYERRSVAVVPNLLSWLWTRLSSILDQERMCLVMHYYATAMWSSFSEDWLYECLRITPLPRWLSCFEVNGMKIAERLFMEIAVPYGIADRLGIAR